MRIFFIGLLALVLSADSVPPQKVLPADASALLSDSLSALLRHQLDTLTSPAMDARKVELRTLQQRGYADVLAAVLDDDGVSAFLSLARMNAQIEYTISHRTLYVYSSVVSSDTARHLPPFLFTYTSLPWQIPLKDDWSMPEDPWKR
jgi:hypothetical protein